LVLAGAGSGKTRVITHRIARLLERGVKPEAILAVSFTNKAAGEMAERMVKLVGRDTASRLVLSTFHSFGVRFLQEEKKALGYATKFAIFDQGDSVGLVREVLREIRRGTDARKLDAMAILSRISKWKNDFLSPDDVANAGKNTAHPDSEYDATAVEIYPRYESGLRAMCAVDFDDLVGVPVRILRKREDIRDKWRKRFRYLLIDEFQDTSRQQLELVRLLTNELGNLCVVGDDDQSIYAWRGADISNILDFDKHFKGAKVVKLEDNYRSKAPILEVANAAIAQSKEKRHGKVLRAARGPGDRVRLTALDDPEQESKFVAAEVRTLLDQRMRPANIAVLYRSNLQARLIEEELRAANVPYRLFGGTQVFDRKEVKDGAAYLRAIAFPRDEISLRRIMNYPARGIGDTTVERIERHAQAHDLSFADAFERIENVKDIPDAARRGAKALHSTLVKARKEFEQGRSLASAAQTLFKDVGLVAELQKAADGAASGERRVGNLNFLVSALDRYEKSERENKPALGNFLHRITTNSDSNAVDETGTDNRVTLSTLHGAKGLEFPYVFLIGVVEGQLPHSRTSDPKVTDATLADVEEERRLFYVGVTRAQDRLYITRYKRRMLRGKATLYTPSRFLDGLPEEFIEEYSRKIETALDTSDIAEMGRLLLQRLSAS
jgi:ATP-dependent DNA helicase Rep